VPENKENRKKSKEREFLMLSLEYYKKIDAKDHVAEIEDRLINLVI
jgi:hypothetical protein